MDYESIKKDFNAVIGRNPLFTKIFFFVFGRFFLRVRYVKKALSGLLGNHGSKKIKILDAGCGSGVYSYYIARKYSNSEVLAGDIQQMHIDNFSYFVSRVKLHNISVKLTDLTAMNNEDEFDIAISVDVMEHILEDVKVFRNIHRALTEKGILLLHTPHISGNSEAHEGAFNDDHVREGYSTEEITDKLKSAGFANVDYRITYGKYGQTAWRVLQKIPITLAAKSKLFYLILPFYFIIAYPISEILMFLDTKSHNLEGGGILVTARK